MGSPLLVDAAFLENALMEPELAIPELIRRAQIGDSAATTRLLRVLRPHLEGIARGYCLADDAGESTADLVQESLLRAWQRLDQFHAEGSEDEVLKCFLGWVGQVVHRLGLNQRRDQLAQRRHPGDRALLRMGAGDGGSTQAQTAPVPASLEPTPSAVYREAEEVRAVQEAIDRFPDPLDRDIIRLHFFDGLSLREVSTRLKVTYETVRFHYQRSLQELERRLGDLE